MKHKVVQIPTEVTELAICDACVNLGKYGPSNLEDMARLKDILDHFGHDDFMVASVTMAYEIDSLGVSDEPCELCNRDEEPERYKATYFVASMDESELRSF